MPKRVAEPAQPLGAPAFAQSQREEILSMIRSAGTVGVSKEVLLFEKHWSQAAARVFELEQQGFQIKHVQREGEKYVRYVLESEPLELKPLASSVDWYERQTGRPRPSSANGSELPLFERVASQ